MAQRTSMINGGQLSTENKGCICSVGSIRRIVERKGVLPRSKTESEMIVKCPSIERGGGTLSTE